MASDHRRRKPGRGSMIARADFPRADPVRRRLRRPGALVAVALVDAAVHRPPRPGRATGDAAAGLAAPSRRAAGRDARRRAAPDRPRAAAAGRRPDPGRRLHRVAALARSVGAAGPAARTAGRRAADGTCPTTPRCTRTTAGWRCSTRSSSPTGSTATPAEPSAPLVVDAVTEVEHGGRPAWEAVVRADAVYEPRCGCCPLLRTRYDRPPRVPGRPEYVLPVYPEAYRVRLDVEHRGLRAHRGDRRAHARAGARPADRGGRRADGRRPVRRAAAASALVPPPSVAGADLADGAEQHPERGDLLLAGPAARQRPTRRGRTRGRRRCARSSGGQSTAASAISSNAARTSSAVTCARPNDRMPGVSMTVPPAGRSNSTADDDVCRPLPILLTSPVARNASGTSRLTRVDLPTPDCPTNTLIRQASRSMSSSSGVSRRHVRRRRGRGRRTGRAAAAGWPRSVLVRQSSGSSPPA